MSAFVATLGSPVSRMGATLSLAMCTLDLPDLDRLRELLQRIKEYLLMGGVTLAVVASLLFVGAWVLSWLRTPKKATEGESESIRILPWIALLTSYVPVGLTLVAAIGLFLPAWAPLMLKYFAYAVLAAAFSWLVAVAALFMGGSKADLARSRKALLLAGTPWYALAVWISSLG